MAWHSIWASMNLEILSKWAKMGQISKLAVTMATKDERWKNYQIYTFGQKDSSNTKYEKNPFFEVCHFLLIFCDCLANPLLTTNRNQDHHPSNLSIYLPNLPTITPQPTAKPHPPLNIPTAKPENRSSSKMGPKLLIDQ